MVYKNIIKCERCTEAISCGNLNPDGCHEYGSEIDSISCPDNAIILEEKVPYLTLNEL